MIPYLISNKGDVNGLHARSGSRFVLNAGPFRGKIMYTNRVDDISEILGNADIWDAGWSGAQHCGTCACTPHAARLRRATIRAWAVCNATPHLPEFWVQNCANGGSCMSSNMLCGQHVTLHAVTITLRIGGRPVATCLATAWRLAIAMMHLQGSTATVASAPRVQTR